MASEHIERLISEFRAKYPPLITLEQAAEISQLPLGTIYDYSSRGRFDGFKYKLGRHRRLDLAQFVESLLDEKEPLNT